MVRCALPAVLLLGVLLPAPAHAWTDAAVRSVRAEVTIDGEARARVALTVDVHVHGGWLEGLDLAGFDPDLVVDEASPAFALDQAGERYTPTIRTLEGGRIQLSFARHSPRRGRVTIVMAYHTSLAHRATEPLPGEDRVRVRWALPGWSGGLDGVQIDVLAPPGSTMAPGQRTEPGASLTTLVEERDGRAALRWRRAHLPRTVSWVVAVDVPAAAMAPSLRGPPVLASTAPAPHRAARALPRVDPRFSWFAFALAIGLLVVLKTFCMRRLARLARSAVAPLVPLPAIVRLPLALVGCALGGWLGAAHPWPAIAALASAALLSAYRAGLPPPPSRLGAWRDVDARWIHAARRASTWSLLAPRGLLDVTTPLGAAHALAWLSLPLSWPALAGPPMEMEMLWLMAVLPLPILATGTRLSFPPGPTASLSRLLRFARRLRDLPDGVALRPTMHIDARGELQDARLRAVLAHRPRGLLRLDVAIAHVRHLGGWANEPVLLVLTRAGSAADLALREALPEVDGEESSGGRRVARLLRAPGRDVADLARVLVALAGCPDAPASSRGTAVLEETFAALPAPRAVGL